MNGGWAFGSSGTRNFHVRIAARSWSNDSGFDGLSKETSAPPNLSTISLSEIVAFEGALEGMRDFIKTGRTLTGPSKVSRAIRQDRTCAVAAVAPRTGLSDSAIRLSSSICAEFPDVKNMWAYKAGIPP
jgi:hypothetical protein